MPRIALRRFSRITALVFVAVLSLSIAAAASADTPPGRGSSRRPAAEPTPPPPAGGCAVLRVRLNGAQPATRTCLAQTLDAREVDAAAPDPAAGAVSGCYSSDLKLYQHTKFGDQRICFYGYGSANLANYLLYSWQPFSSWTDQVSSFITGEHVVHFYEHDTWRGERLRYAPYQSRAYMPSGWNDRISSLCFPGGYSDYCP